MKQLCLFMFFVILTASCTEEAAIIPKDFPVIETLNASEISKDGVTLNGEFLTLGNNEIIEYGFVFDAYDPVLSKADSVVILSEAKENAFSTSIQRGLAGNITYHVKAYAKTDLHLIYGNSMEFESLGSKENPWDLIHEPLMSGWHDAIGISTENMGFILFQSESFYAFNPQTNEVIRKPDIPMDGNTGTIYASFTIDNNIYIISNDSREVLKYDIAHENWSKLAERPSMPIDVSPILGFGIQNKGYLIIKRQFYGYSPESDTWNYLGALPFTAVSEAEVINDCAYVISSNKEVWSFNADNGVWNNDNTYPGEWNGKIVCFTQGDRIYCGMGYYGAYSGAPLPSRDFWEYNPGNNTWKRTADFPLYHSQSEVFTFSIDAYAYFGYFDPAFTEDNNGYLIFRFDSP